MDKDLIRQRSSLATTSADQSAAKPMANGILLNAQNQSLEEKLDSSLSKIPTYPSQELRYGLVILDLVPLLLPQLVTEYLVPQPRSLFRILQ